MTQFTHGMGYRAPLPQQQAPTVDPNAGIDPGYDILVQALMAKEAQESADAWRAKSRPYPGWGSVLMTGLNSAVAGQQEKKARAAEQEVARLGADQKALEAGEKRKMAYDLIKAQNPEMDDGQALTLAKAAVAGMFDLDKLMTKAEGPKITDVNALQTQITNTIGKDMRERSNAIRDIYEYAQKGSGFSDHALIFRYMKFLDPTSTVREGEFATVEQTGSVPQFVRNMYNKALNGEKLSPQQRQDIVAAAAAAYPAYVQQYAAELAPFKERAEAYGVDWGQISVPEPWMPPKQAPQQKKAAPARRQDLTDVTGWSDEEIYKLPDGTHILKDGKEYIVRQD